MRTRWAVLHLNKNSMFLIYLGLKHHRDFWRGETIKEKGWYNLYDIVFGQRWDRTLPIRLHNDD